MKKTAAIALAFLLLLSLCACGSSYSKDSAMTEEASYVTGYSNDFYYDEVPEEEVWYADGEYGGFAADTSAASGTGSAEEGSTASDIDPEKIIYSADAQLETTTFDETLTALNEMISSYGGFVESSSINGSNYYNKSRGNATLRSASYTIRIPSSSFSTVMTELSSLGNVPYSNTYTENISSQYYDVKARLEAYEAQEDRLIEMMEIAESVEDIITIEDRLTEVRYMIDSFQSSLNNWDRQVSYSTISLYISEVSEYTPTEKVKVTYGEKLAQAVKDGLEGVGDFFADFLLWFIEALPTLIILAAIAFVIILIIRKGRPKRQARKAARALRKANSASAPEPVPDEDGKE